MDTHFAGTITSAISSDLACGNQNFFVFMNNSNPTPLVDGGLRAALVFPPTLEARVRARPTPCKQQGQLSKAKASKSIEQQRHEQKQHWGLACRRLIHELIHPTYMQTIPSAPKNSEKHCAPTWVQVCYFAFLCAFSAL
jgi:hypothetical protein